MAPPLGKPIISVSGLRGVVGQSLTPEVAIRYAVAFAAVLPPGPVLVARDSRPSGTMLLEAISAGLRGAGREAIHGGILSTPTVGVLVHSLQAAGAIQVSASHNPPEYNGMKLFDGSGRVIPARFGEKVLAAYHEGKASWASHDHVGSRSECDQGAAVHLKSILRLVDVDRIGEQQFRVVLDANHGAGGQLGKMLLESLGCEVTVLGGEPDGQFEHPPEPTVENLATVATKVRSLQADVGFCQDPDADRLAIIDAAGRCLSEEYTLAICVRHILQTRQGPIVANCATSQMTQMIAAQHGVPFIRTAVGEANVVDAMIEHRALFGGEGNGGPIDPRVGWVRDSFVGMALVLDAMAARRMTVAQLADELPPCCILKTKVRVPIDKVDSSLRALENRFPRASVDRTDGLRLDWQDRWLLVRPSNTEPVVRIIAEGPTTAVSGELCEMAKQAIAEYCEDG